MRFTTKLLPSQSGNLGVITLNNPKALHALTQDMIDCFQDVFTLWHKKDGSSGIKGILIKSSDSDDKNNNKDDNDDDNNKKKKKRLSFCAGGDVKAVYQKGLNDENPQDFFFQEYRVNHSIATSWSEYQIPIVSLWNGIVMGGGCGISMHGKYRVATEHTILAMPETAIGLFPDVGSTYWMNQLLCGGASGGAKYNKRSVANYIALTGARLYAADLIHTGLATHYVPSDQLPDLELALVEATEQPITSTSTSTAKTTSNTNNTNDVLASVLMSFHQHIPTKDCFLKIHEQDIQQTFSEDTIEAMIANLEKQAKQQGSSNSSTFALDTLNTLQKMSPTSLKLTLEGLKRGAKCTSLAEALQMEFRMARACVTRNNSSSNKTSNDFYEGVRAMLVDKDFSPQWNPSSLEDVTDEMIQEYFAPINVELRLGTPSSSSSSSKL